MVIVVVGVARHPQERPGVSETERKITATDTTETESRHSRSSQYHSTQVRHHHID